jgi:hypothetical protein
MQPLHASRPSHLSIIQSAGTDLSKYATKFHQNQSGQPGLSQAGRFGLEGDSLCAYCCGALSGAASAAAAVALESAEGGPAGAMAAALVSRVK